MALQALPSPDSHSPSPDFASDADAPSADASPVSSSSALYPHPVSDEGPFAGQQQHSPRGTPARMAMDLSRSSSGSKGGCWTCRVRRKKCDEEREGDSCKTCLRLRIKCLGWGHKRPDWMRDKDKVAAYKASIKEQLSRMGLIRGQPRQPWHAGLASQPPTPGVAGPGPSTQLRRSVSAREPPYRRSAAHGAPRTPYHQLGMPGPLPDGEWPRRNLAPSSSGRHHTVAPMAAAGMIPTGSTVSLPDTIYGFPSPPLSMSGHEDLPYTNYGTPHTIAMPMTPAVQPQPTPPPMQSPPTPAAIRLEEYIDYYFKYVRELQYVFAGDSLTQILLPIVRNEPEGAVAHSLCALAALHHARLRIARGDAVEDPDKETSLPRKFHDRALALLRHAPETNGHGQYADTDAVAALQLVAYSLLGGGSMPWLALFDVAADWFAQTGIYSEENPKLTLLRMSPAGRFAAKATMYLDIFSSITLMRPPRFLSLYRRLFGMGAGYWGAAGADVSSRLAELSMDKLTGCPDEALLAIAEVSALAHWKTAELAHGTLSHRELVHRGDAIEKELRDRAAGRGASEGGADDLVSMQMRRDGSRQIVGEMFREAAVMYLHTVISDSAPGVPEIHNSIEQMAKLLNDLPPSPYDRTLVFPLLLTGCLTDNQMMREVIKHRFFMQDATMGNILLSQTVMESVWAHRAAAVAAAHQAQQTQPGEQPPALLVGDWRTHLRMQWASLLPV
ncbi:fungal-specific transcription factor domain-containing protein [Epithele typhae]|uniref:fungal-specific transcription factor domain-containing protein n=1 Tax=Epithele typhae TaxID=378194 RepID=UPI0020079837|nr:fungal-specific transcription factor domain-containing protein [Epithele typhae]KAH9945025.1 fungal-specific transcription factor domain-containing protein [Epithele typhae]